MLGKPQTAWLRQYRRLRLSSGSRVTRGGRRGAEGGGGGGRGGGKGGGGRGGEGGGKGGLEGEAEGGERALRNMM